MTADFSTCMQIQCGAITQDQAGADLLYACSKAGYVGARACADQLCAPYKQAMIQNQECPAAVADSALAAPIYLPKPTSQTMPNIVADARRNGGGSPSSVPFSPDTILNPMPRIVAPPMDSGMEQTCGGFASWVSANPVMAGLGLVGLYFVLQGMRGK